MFQPGPCDLEPIFDVFVDAIKIYNDARCMQKPTMKEMLCRCLGVVKLAPSQHLQKPKKVLILGSGGKFRTKRKSNFFKSRFSPIYGDGRFHLVLLAIS